MAPGQKKAARLKASLVFLDESGLLLAPLVRRSWAPRGRTPILYQPGRSREKVSMIAALSISPKRRRVGLYFSLRPNANVTTSWVVVFLRELARHLRGPVILIWDRLPSHRARGVLKFLERRRRIHSVLLPPYAPELNPVEGFWSYFKQNPLANLSPEDAKALASIARRHAQALRGRTDLLRSLIQWSPLSLRWS
jgi:transposase